jgi:hypothetical protein
MISPVPRPPHGLPGLLGLGMGLALAGWVAAQTVDDALTTPRRRDATRLSTEGRTFGPEVQRLQNENPRTAREEALGPGVAPNWTNPPAFAADAFTFVRVHYDVDPEAPGSSGQLRWSIDFPDSDLNLSWRLRQLTSLQVNPDGRVLRLTEPDLARYPFLYLVEPGRLLLADAEVEALRRYLLNGGFLMFDDFWGEREWGVFEREMKKVFPDRKPVDLPMSHPIFHCVFDLRETPQVPGLPHYQAGRTYERADAREPHYRGISDDKGRLMVLICHNTDMGDGWEREGEDEGYFREHSEKFAYPLGVNIIFYAMTH